MSDDLTSDGMTSDDSQATCAYDNQATDAAYTEMEESQSPSKVPALPLDIMQYILALSVVGYAHMSYLRGLPLISKNVYWEGMKLLYTQVPQLEANRLLLLTKSLRDNECLRPLVSFIKLSVFAGGSQVNNHAMTRELLFLLTDLRKLHLHFDRPSDLAFWTQDEIASACTTIDALKLSRGNNRDDNVFLQDEFLLFLYGCTQMSQLQIAHFESVPGMQIMPLSTKLTRLLVDTSDLSGADLLCLVKASLFTLHTLSVQASQYATPDDLIQVFSLLHNVENLRLSIHPDNIPDYALDEWQSKAYDILDCFAGLRKLMLVTADLDCKKLGLCNAATSLESLGVPYYRDGETNEALQALDPVHFPNLQVIVSDTLSSILQEGDAESLRWQQVVSHIKLVNAKPRFSEFADL